MRISEDHWRSVFHNNSVNSLVDFQFGNFCERDYEPKSNSSGGGGGVRCGGCGRGRASVLVGGPPAAAALVGAVFVFVKPAVVVVVALGGGGNASLGKSNDLITTSRLRRSSELRRPVVCSARNRKFCRASSQCFFQTASS